MQLYIILLYWKNINLKKCCYNESIIKFSMKENKQEKLPLN